MMENAMSCHDPKPFGPKPLGDATRHYWLVQDMARAAGVDLAADAAAGRLDQAQWAGMVERCRGCDWERTGGCHRWLADQADGTATVPDLCANVKTFGDLKA